MAESSKGLKVVVLTASIDFKIICFMLSLSEVIIQKASAKISLNNSLFVICDCVNGLMQNTIVGTCKCSNLIAFVYWPILEEKASASSIRIILVVEKSLSVIHF